MSNRPTNSMTPGGGGARRAAAASPRGAGSGSATCSSGRLGHGGMAVVWLATDERLGRPVAIKVLSDTLADDAEYLDRFRREAKVAAGLQHPNLVSVYDFDAGERPYLVMEYIEGGDLAERIAAATPPTRERARARAALGAPPHPRRGRAAPRHQAAERAHRRATATRG